MLTIEGEQYLGVFRGSLKSGDLWVGSEYTEAKHRAYWYEGTAFVVDKLEGSQRFWFAFETEHIDTSGNPKDYSLEEAIVYFRDRRPSYPDGSITKLLDGVYPKVVDLSLRQIRARILESRDEIPSVQIQELRVRDLVEKGLAIGIDGEIKLPL